MFMRNSLIATAMNCGLLLPCSAAEPAKAAPPSPTQKLVVHEWGTFLGVQGSDGATLGGMVASEEALPPFVEQRSWSTWDRVSMRSKMETPVTYFYTDRPLTVNVRVDMPKGVLTHWFPMVANFGPPAEKAPAPHPPEAYRSFLSWEKIELIPHQPNLAIEAGKVVPTLWRVKATDPWRFARDTDSAFVKGRARNMKDWSEFDFEKFLFYRGLGTFDLPLEVRTSQAGSDVQLLMHNRDAKPLTGMFAISVGKNALRFGPLGELAGSMTKNVSLDKALTIELPLTEGTHPVMKKVAEALMVAGLYEKEAWAMVYSWEKSYFRTEGLRILFVLPRETTDAYIPIQITPKPQEVVRVMVGRVELLTPAQERQIEQWVEELGAPEFKTREAAQAGLAKLGRLSEPALRRVMAITHSAEVRKSANQLIQAAVRAQ
ncbi:MAG: hypothetical protein ACJ8F7_13690 [Gemmataceae bacterium]